MGDMKLHGTQCSTVSELQKRETVKNCETTYNDTL